MVVFLKKCVCANIFKRKTKFVNNKYKFCKKQGTLKSLDRNLLAVSVKTLLFGDLVDLRVDHTTFTFTLTTKIGYNLLYLSNAR